MEKFTTFQAIAAPLALDNIDTDMIIPKGFLKTIKRTGLGKNLFHEMRYDQNGELIADFILNRKPYDQAKILVSGLNFGCGSSREHAPWALKDFGIKAIIASSYADIFYNNSFKNALLPIIVSKAQLAEIHQYLAAKTGNQIKIDLAAQQISLENGQNYHFNLSIFH